MAETLASLDERVVAAAFDAPALLAQVALTGAEGRLARIDPGYSTASSASRLDAFLLPDSLQFAEYNAESPAGPGDSETLAEIFSTLPVMSRFLERCIVHRATRRNSFAVREVADRAVADVNRGRASHLGRDDPVAANDQFLTSARSCRRNSSKRFWATRRRYFAVERMSSIGAIS